MKSTVIIEPVASSVHLLEAAARLGYRTIVVAQDAGDRTVPPEARSRAGEIVRCDTHDLAALTRTLQHLAAERDVRAVVPGFDDWVTAVSRINAQLKLPGLPADGADCLRNRYVMRSRLVERGVRVPRFAYVESQAALLEAARATGYPAVLKSAEGSGSMQVRRVSDQAQLLEAYRELEAARAAGPGRALRDGLLLEECVSGQAISAQGYVSTTGVELVSITQKLLGPEPWCVEMGHIVEGRFDAETRQQITAHVRQLAAALDLTMGVLHCELRLSRSGPVAIEVSAMPAWISALIERAKEVSLPELMIRAYAGEPIAARPPSTRGHAGISFLAAPPDLGVFLALEGLSSLRERVPGVEEVSVYASPGDRLRPLIDARARLGHVIVTAPTYDELIRRLAAVKQRVVVRGAYAAEQAS